MNKALIAAGELVELLKGRSGRAYGPLRELYPESEDLSAKAGLWLEAGRTFCREWGPGAKVFSVRTTGRVNLMGMHADHRGGYVNPIAVGEDFFIVGPRDDDVVELRNADATAFESRQFKISQELPGHKIRDWDAWTHDEFAKRQRQGSTGDWSNYFKAGVLYLQHSYTRDDGRFDPPLRGMNVAVKGNVPMASGLSSSSALVVGSMEACLRVNGLQMEPLGMVEACRLAEWYVGTRGGGGDHAAIKCGKKDHILHIGSFPFSVSAVPFPAGYSIVLADSMVQARKQEGVRDRFNERIAAYEFGLLMLRRNFPEHAAKMEHLRDINPQSLRVSEADIYRMIRTLPQRCGRVKVLAELPQQREQIERIFRSHAEPKGGYLMRQVCTYGITECIRSRMAGEMLRQSDVAGFGKLIDISHEGDRVSRLVNGKRVDHDNSIPDEKLNGLIRQAESGDLQAVEQAKLWRQPGGYSVSTIEQDTLVDIARSVPGVIGARLVGAGLGGSIIALVKEDRVGAVIEALAEGYYRASGLPVRAEVVRPLGGAGILEIG